MPSTNLASSRFWAGKAAQPFILIVAKVTLPPDFVTFVNSKQGLYVVDLDKPFDTPRTCNLLHQQSKWDVGVVQWNPHHSRASFIASTVSPFLPFPVVGSNVTRYDRRIPTPSYGT